MTTRKGFLKPDGLALFDIGVGIPSFMARAAGSAKFIAPLQKK